jgi:hypothetical protein
MMNTRLALALLIGTITLAACGRETADIPASAAATNTATPVDPASLAPPLLPPGDGVDPVQPPSYEVAIATAAANHNKSLARCAEQPESVRVQCEQEANAAFAGAQTDLEPLRGNQE